MHSITFSTIDIPLLFKLRLAVARFGEKDCAGWWDTHGVLGRIGAAGLFRGFPITHHFAQARIVFTAATMRCNEVFSPPDSRTLWNLPPEIEDSFSMQWRTWSMNPTEWVPVFDTLAAPVPANLLDLITSLNAPDAVTRSTVAKFQLSAQGKAVQLPPTERLDDASLILLAAAFSLGSKGSLAVPYLRAE